MIGIIGGTGLGKALQASETGDWIDVETPFGKPSGPYLKTQWNSTDVIFLNRHGDGHIFNPSNVPYRANIFGFKKLGAKTILASGAVGSLREDIHPGELVICDQVIDRTYARNKTFFDTDVVAHVEFAEPFCPVLREAILEAGKMVSTTVHPQGTYVCMEGPQFSTRAESLMHQKMGGDLIGMTCMPEAKLAREAEMAYALIALPTDYDCWRPHNPGMDKQALSMEIIDNLNQATEKANELIRATVDYLSKNSIGHCFAWDALSMAIWSNPETISTETRKRLEPLIGKYMPA